MSKFLHARGIVKEYPQADTPLRVLDGVSLDVSEGEFLVVVGTSGAGKSTLLHVLGLLDSPTKGDVIFKGENLSRLPGRRQAGLRNRLFGFVFQFFHLLPDFNAIENVMMPAVVGCGILKWAGRRREARGRAEELLGRLGLGERLLHRPTQLSGGERQRVAICRALMNKPSVLLLDEPTGNLDTKRGNEILDLIREMNESEGQTVVMVTHDQAASKRASRTVRIRDGRIA